MSDRYIYVPLHSKSYGKVLLKQNIMENIQELVSELNKLKIFQKSMDFLEDLPDEIYMDHFKDSEEVASDLEIDKRRWYEMSTQVRRLKSFPEVLLGVRLVTNLYSEMSTVDDLYHVLVFFEVEEVQSTTYKRK